MIKIYCFFLSLLLLELQAYAEDFVQTSTQIEQTTESVRRESFPDLASYQITLDTFAESDSYFRSGVHFFSAFRPALHRTYKIYYNPELLSHQLPLEALKGVLAHELVHIRDYTKMSSTELMAFAVGYILDEQSVYERATDEGAIKRGYGKELMAFRHWIYALLNPTQLEKKKRIYLTPEEISRRVNSSRVVKPH